MTNLVLTRKAGQSVRLMINGEAVWLVIYRVNGGACEMAVCRKQGFHCTEELKTVRFRDSMQIAEGVSVCVVDLAKGHAKLSFTAPRDVHILRTELIKEKDDV